MKVTLVTETFPPDVNGVAMTLEHVTRGLAARGHHVHVVRPAPATPAPVSPPGVTLHEVRGLPIPCYPELRFGLPAGRWMARHLRAAGSDLVHVATEGPLGRSAMRVARVAGLPTTSSFHTNFHTYADLYGFGLLRRMTLGWLRKVHVQAACTFVPSESVRRTLADAGFARLAVMGRGVDAGLFSPERRDAALRRSWGAGPDTPVALYLGRLAAEKNLELTIRALEGMRAVEPALRCVFVGDGPLRGQLQRRHPEYVFAGMRRGEDLARHVASGDLFPFASETETFGNVVTEAMASGLLVLAYDYAAARTHIEDGRNGRTVPYGDARAYLDAACALVADRTAWPAVRSAAVETATRLSWDAVVARFEARLQAVVTAGATANDRGGAADPHARGRA